MHPEDGRQADNLFLAGCFFQEFGNSYPSCRNLKGTGHDFRIDFAAFHIREGYSFGGQAWPFILEIGHHLTRTESLQAFEVDYDARGFCGKGLWTRGHGGWDAECFLQGTGRCKRGNISFLRCGVGDTALPKKSSELFKAFPDIFFGNSAEGMIGG